jgi:uncharacterized lipoprotein NlpE involved in copper resistance
MKKTYRSDIEKQCFLLISSYVFFADGGVFTWYEWGLINKAELHVQELGGQRGDGVYSRDNAVYVYG